MDTHLRQGYGGQADDTDHSSLVMSSEVETSLIANDEARMTNDETNPNDQIIGRLCKPQPLSGFAEWGLARTERDRRANRRPSQAGTGESKTLQIFDIRHSDFVINKIRVYSCPFVVNR